MLMRTFVRICSLSAFKAVAFKGFQAVVALKIFETTMLGQWCVFAAYGLRFRKNSSIPRDRTEYTTYTTDAPAEGVSERPAALGEESLRWQVHVCTYPDTPAARFAAGGEDGEACEHSEGRSPMWDTAHGRLAELRGNPLVAACDGNDRVELDRSTQTECNVAWNASVWPASPFRTFHPRRPFLGGLRSF